VAARKIGGGGAFKPLCEHRRELPEKRDYPRSMKPRREYSRPQALKVAIARSRARGTLAPRVEQRELFDGRCGRGDGNERGATCACPVVPSFRRSPGSEFHASERASLLQGCRRHVLDGPPLSVVENLGGERVYVGGEAVCTNALGGKGGHCPNRSSADKAESASLSALGSISLVSKPSRSCTKRPHRRIYSGRNAVIGFASLCTPRRGRR